MKNKVIAVLIAILLGLLLAYSVLIFLAWQPDAAYFRYQRN